MPSSCISMPVVSTHWAALWTLHERESGPEAAPGGHNKIDNLA